ncbi:hypothetical protein BHE74_00016862, partial [Ensete ventricosum]
EPNMSSGGLVEIDPLELKFPCEFDSPSFFWWFAGVYRRLFAQVELKKQISCSLQLINKSDDYVAFKVANLVAALDFRTWKEATAYFLLRRIQFASVTMQSQREAPPDMQCKDKFLVQSVIIDQTSTTKDITTEMVLVVSSNYITAVAIVVMYVLS